MRDVIYNQKEYYPDWYYFNILGNEGMWTFEVNQYLVWVVINQYCINQLLTYGDNFNFVIRSVSPTSWVILSSDLDPKSVTFQDALV